VCGESVCGENVWWERILADACCEYVSDAGACCVTRSRACASNALLEDVLLRSIRVVLARCTPHCAHHAVYTTLSHHAVHTTLCTPRCAHHTVHTTLCTPHCAHHTVHCAHHTVHTTVNGTYCTIYCLCDRSWCSRLDGCLTFVVALIGKLQNVRQRSRRQTRRGNACILSQACEGLTSQACEKV
jgi:hypothetical protein